MEFWAPFFSFNYVFNVCNNRICDCNGTKGCGDTFGTKCNSENNRKTGTFYCLRYILECLSLRTTKRNVITFFWSSIWFRRIGLWKAMPRVTVAVPTSAYVKKCQVVKVQYLTVFFICCFSHLNFYKRPKVFFVFCCSPFFAHNFCRIDSNCTGSFLFLFWLKANILTILSLILLRWSNCLLCSLTHSHIRVGFDFSAGDWKREEKGNVKNT